MRRILLVAVLLASCRAPDQVWVAFTGGSADANVSGSQWVPNDPGWARPYAGSSDGHIRAATLGLGWTTGRAHEREERADWFRHENNVQMHQLVATVTTQEQRTEQILVALDALRAPAQRLFSQFRVFSTEMLAIAGEWVSRAWEALPDQPPEGEPGDEGIDPWSEITTALVTASVAALGVWAEIMRRRRRDKRGEPPA